MEKNPDMRTLPEGWTQHYEPSKQLWYYVQINVTPPKVSFTHPLDAGPSNSRSQQGSNKANMNPGPHLAMEVKQANLSSSMSMPSPPQPRRTRAQELYASSASREALPMISTRHIQSFSTAPDPSLLPAGPSLSSYPQAEGNRSLPLVAPIRPPDVSHALLSPQHERHSTQSLQAVRHSHEPPRAQMYAAAGHRGLDPSIKQGNGPRHLTTKAAPPSELPTPVFPSRLHHDSRGIPASSSSAPRIPVPFIGQNSGSTITVPSPPTSSILFSASPSSVGIPVSSPPMSPNPPPTSPPTFTTSPSNALPAAPHSASPAAILPPPKPTMTSNNGNDAARVAIGAMFKIAGGVLATTTGSSSNLINTVGKIVTNPTVFNTLSSAFSNKQNIGISDAQLQAVMQAKPGADYQGVINALMHQQQAYQQQSAAYMQAHPGMIPRRPSTDFQALIVEVQRLQRVSQQAVSNSQFHQPQNQQLAPQHPTQQWAPQQQQQSQHSVPQPQQQYHAQQFVPQQQPPSQQSHTLPQQTQALPQQQPHNLPFHQQQAVSNAHVPAPQQQPQSEQNHYVQAFHAMQHLYHDMTDQQQQQQQQPSVTEPYDNNDYSFSGDNTYGQQQPQPPPQSPMANIFNNISSALSDNGQSQPTFDPSSLYTGDPNNGAGFGGGGCLLDALNQTLGTANSSGGQTDASGMAALLTGVNQAFNPLNNFGQGGADFGLGSDNSGWQQY